MMCSCPSAAKTRLSWAVRISRCTPMTGKGKRMSTIKYPVYHTLTLILVLLLTGCGGLKEGVLSSAVQKPQVTIDYVSVSGISFSAVDLTLTMKVKNPNNYALALSGYDYDVKFNDLQLVKGTTDQGFRVPAGATDQIKIPLTVAFDDVAKIYQSMGQSNQVDYDANVDLRLDAPILNLFKLNTQKQGSIAIPRLPKVSFGNLKVKKFSFTDIQLALDMAVDNPNDFAMQLKDIVYDISVNAQAWLTGSVDNNLEIAKNKTSKLTIPLRVKLTELSGGLLQAIQGGRFQGFDVKGSFVLDGDHSALNNIKVPISFTGK